MTPGTADTARVEAHRHLDEAPRWALPAAPVADTLRGIQADPATGDPDLHDFARGLGLRYDLVEGILTGSKRELTLEEIAQVCESLHCTPPDLWNTQLSASITHAYGPDQWPSERQPLDRPVDDARPEPAGPWFATAYRTTHVVAVTPAGERIPLDDLDAPAEANSDYYLAFWQMSHPQPVDIPTDEPISVPAPAHDSHPVLAPIADAVRSSRPKIEMVRFTNVETGQEHWLGHDARSGAWHAWDHPAEDYPGPTAELLSSGFYNDPSRLLPVNADQLDLDLGDGEDRFVEELSVEL